MAKLLISFVLAILLATSLSESRSAFPTSLELNNNNNNNNEAVNLHETLEVFEPGYFPTKLVNVDESKLARASPPKPLLIARPAVAGKYPVILFIHGTCLMNSFYSRLFEHIASHGYIVVAPQVYSCTIFGAIPVMPIGGQREVDVSTEVANWIPSNLDKALNGSVKADLDKLVIAGHSRGGKTAFAMQLGRSKDVKLTTQFSAIVGVDPVAGPDKEIEPKILTNVPDSFNLSVPVATIGTGLGGEPSCWLVCPPCAPPGVNHAQFFFESRPFASDLVTTDYGHMDMLDDNLPGMMGIMARRMCTNSNKSKDPMRRTVGGIIVAFLNSLFYGKHEDYSTILLNPSVAPAQLNPVVFKEVEYLSANA